MVRSEIREESFVRINLGHRTLEASLIMPEAAQGVVLFAHQHGSGRNSPRGRHVAKALERVRIATLLVDLFTDAERGDLSRAQFFRSNLDLIAERMGTVSQWLGNNPRTAGRRVGYLGAGLGAGAALLAAAGFADAVSAIVSIAGRTEVAGPSLGLVRAPTLMIVGEDDPQTHFFNRQALQVLRTSEKSLVLIPGASNLFEETGAWDQIARATVDWFARHLIHKRLDLSRQD